MLQVSDTTVVSKVCTVNCHHPSQGHKMVIPFDVIISLLVSLTKENDPRKGKSISQRFSLFFMTVTSSILNALITAGQVNSDGPILGNIKIDGHGVLQDGQNT